MSPLDALTQQRIRALEITLSWLIGQSIAGQPEYVPDFVVVSMEPTYILDFAEKVTEAYDEYILSLKSEANEAEE